MEKLYIIDAVGFIFRAYHAIRYMTNSKGKSTNALFGFIQSIQKLRRDFTPSHMVAVFDGPDNKASRLEIYEDYKANRGEAPADLYEQIQAAKQFCELAGIPSLQVAGVEADDTMGSIARWAGKQGSLVYLCTSDKDMAQIVDERISLLNTHKDNLILDPEGVMATYGVRPDQIVDWLSMVGDSSDNVPGLPGFGPKTASTLLQKYDNLDAILAHPEDVPGKKKQETLREKSDLAELSRRLVTLNLDVEFPQRPEFFQLDPPSWPPLRDFLQENDFDRLLRDMAPQEEAESPPAEKDAPTYTLVNDLEALDALLETLQSSSEICFDTETTDLHPMTAELVGLGFCVKEAQAWYVPVNGALGKEKVLTALKPIFEDPSHSFIAQNAKYDLHILENEDIQVANVSFDTILASYLLHSHDRRHSLDHLAQKYFQFTKTPTEALIGKGAKQVTMAEVPIPQVSDYCCEDVDYTLRLKEVLAKELEERRLGPLFQEMEMPLLRVLQQMERKGIHLEVEALKSFQTELEQEIASLSQQIWDLAGEEFNLNSPKQLGDILFGKLDIPPLKKTQTGFSTNAEVLESLAPDYPIVAKVLAYRSLEKLRSTYVETLPVQVNEHTNRIHCTFSQSVAATGRLACQNPNLQNIPIRTALGRRIREAFTPSKPNWSFLSADYSQIELRLLAHMSEDPTLVQAFKQGEDIHAATASQIFEVPLEQVSKTQRRQAKAVNFGIIYGQQAFGLSRELQIDMKEAQAFIERYFQRFSRVKEFIEECKEKARQTGKAVTLTGRERILPEIHSKNPQLRQASERLAVNSPLQGTAADLIKIAMLRVQEALDREQLLSYMVLQVHDELIFETPDHELLSLEPLVKTCMQEVWSLRVPLLVDVSIGKNWKEC